MVRTLLIRGMAAGIAAAVLTFVFQYLVGEPALDGGIAFEDRVAEAAGEPAGVEMISRGTQSTVGLAVALLLYGVAVGGIFALVFAAAYGRLGRLSGRATSAVLALVGFVVVVVVPFLKYPANPPASSIDDTIGDRTGTYVLMVAASVLVAAGAVLLGRRLVARFGSWNGVLLATLGYVVVMGVVGALLPVVDETPAAFPATVLYDFRLASLGGQLVLWTVLGLAFGAMADRGAWRTNRASVEPASR
jgi:predicted cobalt transporter CbtA